MQPDVKDKINYTVCRYLADPNSYRVESVQSLWSGYGEVARYYSPRLQHTVIAKVINLSVQGKHPRGWQSDTSHQRKLSSYLNEQAFYQHYAQSTTEECAVPFLIALGQSEECFCVIMEDLDARGLSMRYLDANRALAKQGVNWLASFHATFMQQDLPELWPIGTYWHLATRPDEWQKMQHGQLKQAAQAIDNTLNQARFQTLLHGDAKLANFCFHTKTGELAAVDFQYTGRGAGIKDLVYFLGSCFSENELHKYADGLVDDYFSELSRTLVERWDCAQISELENEWRSLIPFAWADFERFLSGWAPSHHKLNGYSKRQTQLALNALI